MNQVLMIAAEEMGNLMNLYNQSKKICKMTSKGFGSKVELMLQL